METLTPDDILQVCRENAAEIGESLTRTFDRPVEVKDCETVSQDTADWLKESSGAGLVLVFTGEQQGAVALLEASGGLLPDWCAEPDASGQSKLTTLAQELGMLLLPESHMPADFVAQQVDTAREAILRGEPSAEAKVVQLALEYEGSTDHLLLLWPVAKPEAIFVTVDQEPSPAPEPSASAEPAQKPPKAPTQEKQEAPRSDAHRRTYTLADLPPYSRSLLQVEVPLIVTLARQKIQVHRLLEMGPGTIIQFDKQCDDMLDLSVGEHRIGRGEAVKVGEKFGLRLTSITLPTERFVPQTPRGGNSTRRSA